MRNSIFKKDIHYRLNRSLSILKAKLMFTTRVYLSESTKLPTQKILFFKCSFLSSVAFVVVVFVVEGNVHLQHF